MKYSLYIVVIILFFSNNINLRERNNYKNILHSKISNNVVINNGILNIKPIKFSHTINTSASEYYPCISPDGQYLYFTGMDRTGYFDYKIDFSKSKNNGGEDIFYSKLLNGSWEDARDLKILNTNGHEAINQVLQNGDLLITGNYPENMGPNNVNNGSNTTDIFLAIKKRSYGIIHFDEPINSIYNEADAFMTKDKNVLLFVSDRPGCVGSFHKKGWFWNNSYWGNTDLYVSFKNGDAWTTPLNLGKTINTAFSERSPFLSSDGLKLYLSTNGYNFSSHDLNIYYFIRKDINDWKNWQGPFENKLINSSTDDWGYKEDIKGNSYFARANKLDYIPTKKGKDGTGFIFETNFRAGYSIYGQQSGSFIANEQIDLYFINNDNVAVILPDILFDSDSYKLKSNPGLINKIIDLIEINQPTSIKIIGYTDSDGPDKHNLELSLNRANEIKRFIISRKNNLKIDVTGRGKDNPIASNFTSNGKALNRRVEIKFQ